MQFQWSNVQTALYRICVYQNAPSDLLCLVTCSFVCTGISTSYNLPLHSQPTVKFMLLVLVMSCRQLVIHASGSEAEFTDIHCGKKNGHVRYVVITSPKQIAYWLFLQK